MSERGSSLWSLAFLHSRTRLSQKEKIGEESLSSTFLLRALLEFYKLCVPCVESSFDGCLWSDIGHIVDIGYYPKHVMLIHELFQALVVATNIALCFHMWSCLVRLGVWSVEG